MSALVSRIPRLARVAVASVAASAAVFALGPPPALGEGSPIITTIAGAPCGGDVATGMAVQPLGVEPDGEGGFFVAHYPQASICHVDAAGRVTHIAGTGAMLFGGDGGPATAASLYEPSGLAYDRRTGALFVADRANHRVRKIDTTGVITTVAGTGRAGSAGDGGAATAAQLHYPTGVEVDADGNLYVADTKNHRIRRVGASGVMTTVAGTGAIGGAGDGGPATGAMLNSPAAVALGHDGTLYVADTGNNRVRAVSTAGVISAFSGTGVGGYSGDGGPATLARHRSPGAVAASASSVYIADTTTNRVRKVSLASKVISTAIGTGTAGFGGDGGSATAARIAWPAGVAVDGDNVFIADTGNNRVRRVAGGVITTVAGNGTPARVDGAGSASQLYQPLTLHVAPDGSVLVADGHNNSIRRVSADGTVTTLAGTGRRAFGGDGGPATSASLSFPTGVTIDPAGHLVIADQQNHRIRRVDAVSGVITTIAGTGAAGFSGDGGSARAAQLNAPSSVAVTSTGAVLVADSGNNRIRRIAADGTISTIAGTGVAGYAGDGALASAAAFKYPTHVTTDGNGNVVVTDRYNSRIRRIDAVTGIVTTIAGNGRNGYSGEGLAATESSLLFPGSVAFAPDGSLYIADTGNQIIRRVTDPGTPLAKMVTVAGWTPAAGIRPTKGVVGDGGHPRAAMLDNPTGVAVDASGRWYIADSLSNRVRKVSS